MGRSSAAGPSEMSDQGVALYFKFVSEPFAVIPLSIVRKSTVNQQRTRWFIFGTN